MTNLSAFLRKHGLILLIVIAGALIRLFALGGQSLWRDEGISVELSHMGAAEIIQNRAGDNHAPLYFVFLHYWVRLFGDSEFSVRLPGVVFGTVAVYLLYRFGLLLFEKNIALLAAFLLSVSRLNIAHSREARMYSLVVMLVLLSMHAYTRLQSSWTRRGVLAYLVPSVLLLYTHAYGVFFILVQNVYFLFRALSRRIGAAAVRSWLLLQAVTLLLFSPWLLILFGQIGRRQVDIAATQRSSPGLFLLATTFGQYASSSLPLAVLYLLLLIAAIWALLIRSGRLKPNLLYAQDQRETAAGWPALDSLVLLVSWGAIPVLLPFALSQIISPFFSSRYTIGATPALYLLVALSVSRLKRRLLRYALILLIAVLSVFALASYYRETVLTPYYREVTQFVNEQAGERDWVLLYNHDVRLFKYYGLRSDLRLAIYSRTRSAGEVLPHIPLADDERLWHVTYMRGGTGGLQKNQEFAGGRMRLARWWEYQHNVVLLQYEGGSTP